jgi:hypothetical protein
MKKAENDSLYCFFWLRNVICFQCIPLMYINNYIHIIFKIWYVTMILNYYVPEAHIMYLIWRY